MMSHADFMTYIFVASRLVLVEPVCEAQIVVLNVLSPVD